MQRIVHVIPNEKFTNGYVSLMKIFLTEYEHHFVIYNVMNNLKVEPEIQSGSYIYPVTDKKEVLSDKKIVSLLRECDKVILSGIFRIQVYGVFWSRKIWKKTYMQFWGGDFYRYRNKRRETVFLIEKFTLIRCLNKCRGIITILEDDYDELRKILHFKDKPHFEAPVTRGPKEEIKFVPKTEKGATAHSPVKILLGNSAAEENHHEEIFDILARYADKPFLVYCPLSYGKEEYKNHVMQYGKNILGDKFVPITQFMERPKYNEFLEDIDIAVFNNDRQQALGNINILSAMGKKIYLREGTSMWKKYQRVGFVFNSIGDLKKESFEEFIKIDPKSVEINKTKKLETIETRVEKWRQILGD